MENMFLDAVNKFENFCPGGNNHSLHLCVTFLHRKNSSETLKEIDRYSTLEVKTVAIGEIVVQSKDHNLLTTYVHDVLKETNVISDAHKEAIHALVKLSPPEALVNLVETGQQGTLRNSELMAMIKRDEDHIHFMLIGYDLSQP